MVKLLPLCDGNDIPILCLRAFRCESAQQTKRIVRGAFEAGVRHFEMAELFGNAHIVCEALREVRAARNELYISLKLWPKFRKPEELITAANTLLQEIGLDYVDLLMIHAPIDLENKQDQWKAIEDLKDAQVCRSLGVVNVSSVGLTDVLKNCRITPAVYEMEVSPFNQKQELVEFCFDSSMVVINNEPLAKGLKHKTSPLLQQLASQCGCSIDVLLLRYAVAKGFAVGIPEHCIDDLLGNAEGTLIDEPLPSWALQQLDAQQLEGPSGVSALSWVPVEPTPEELLSM